MLDLNLFRDPRIIRESQLRRFDDISLVDQVIDRDKQWRTSQLELEHIAEDMNQLHKEIEMLPAANMAAIKKLEDLKKEIAAKEVKVKMAKKKLDESLSLIGNLLHDTVTVDNDEANNSVVRNWGECRTEGKLLNHVDLVNKLKIADFSKGSKAAGNRGYYLLEAGDELNRALVTFGSLFLYARNYEILEPDFFMRKEIMARCAQLSQFDEELYEVVGDADEKYMIATSEQPLCAYHMDESIDPESLPLRYAGVSTCYRKEAGSHGRDTRGLFRVHEFKKVEQFCITSPNDNKSWEMHEEMLRNAEDFYKALGIPYRVVNIVSGALNLAAAKKYDLEGWFPASQTYRELVSCSNCTDYQARNLDIRYGQKKDEEEAEQFVHLLNCTLTATQRTMCCILENYQTEEGVVIPEVLRPFMSGKDFLPFKN